MKTVRYSVPYLALTWALILGSRGSAELELLVSALVCIGAALVFTIHDRRSS